MHHHLELKVKSDRSLQRFQFRSPMCVCSIWDILDVVCVRAYWRCIQRIAHRSMNLRNFHEKENNLQTVEQC